MPLKSRKMPRRIHLQCVQFGAGILHPLPGSPKTPPTSPEALPDRPPDIHFGSILLTFCLFSLRLFWYVLYILLLSAESFFPLEWHTHARTHTHQKWHRSHCNQLKAYELSNGKGTRKPNRRWHWVPRKTQRCAFFGSSKIWTQHTRIKCKRPLADNLNTAKWFLKARPMVGNRSEE